MINVSPCFIAPMSEDFTDVGSVNLPGGNGKSSDIGLQAGPIIENPPRLGMLSLVLPLPRTAPQPRIQVRCLLG